jgi:CDP-glucose 4,6-dehydratase
MRRDHWRDRPVLVTGATGFLGGWLVKELLARGARVVALVRDGAPRSLFSLERMGERVETIHGFLADRDLLRRVMCEYDIATVFHLAAQALVGVARTDPIGTLEANVAGTWNVLEAVRQSPVREVVVASSDKAYGCSSALPYLESHPMAGRYPYDVSKSCADLICRMYAETYGAPVCITRFGNLFGGGDLNFSRTVPGVIAATLRGERFVIRSDGHFVRDYIYVRDAVNGYLRLAEAMAADPALRGEAFNFSLEVRLTVLDLVQQVLELMGRTDLCPIVQSIATDEIREQYMVASKARRLLGWAPRYTMQQGLRETILWYTNALAETTAPPSTSPSRAVAEPVQASL